MAKDNVDLICDISELAGLFERSHSLSDFLQSAVSIVAYHMRAAVCSIYLYDEEEETLTLAATQGLKPEAVGNVSLKLGEGIVGAAMRDLKPICEGHGSNNPHFKRIDGIFEEHYEAFLAVPIMLRGAMRVGVLVTQDPQPNYFHQNDVKALRAIASQLAVVIENAKLLMSLHEARQQKTEPPAEVTPALAGVSFLKGTTASSGVVQGTAVVIDGHGYDVLTVAADEDETSYTLEDFTLALQESEEQLTALQKHMEERLGDVASLIFNAHLLILKDMGFSGAMKKLIDQGIPADRAISSVVNDYINLFSKSSNPRLREKVLDVKDLGHRLLRNLQRHGEDHGDYEGQILIAKELLPSDVLKFAAQKVEGIIIVQGSVTSHISILARSLRVPMVFVEKPDILEIPEGTLILIDANQGTVFLDPSEKVLAQYEALIKPEEVPPEVVQPETFTRDGTKITLHCNVNLLSDMEYARQNLAEGVGLYRSEFPFIVRDEFPSEEAQRLIYEKIFAGLPGREVTLRTLDVGGDKKLPYHQHLEEANPFLGLRAIRFSLKNPGIFKQQLRAMLRAGHNKGLRIMFPFISSVDDFLAARDMLEECKRELELEGVPYNPNPDIGPMVELPAAVEIIDELARESDFLSIGTNDLIQYLLAVDRTNESVSSLYVCHHPAVLRSVYRIVNSAINNDVDVCVCGDMALNTEMLKFLIGIGVRKISIDAQHIPRIQKFISGLHTEEARRHARKLLRYGTLREVNRFLAEEEA
ncbi:MAG: phosphoenolpyruvate--protein phosphotransferase [Verrucomicrobia bacterium]|nr:phosphoenolpyruvate--protein phosphotransferase [Verrucomicrobiota bacterium]MCH8511290.1 phosphoenolpyruvate--protein phosphotransferase [Kiritimatiellia bacterium]